jgi:hypothetical protein
VSTPVQAPPPGPAVASATAPAVPPIACPSCGTTVQPEQDWCLTCGAAARTRLAPTPNWRVLVAALGALALAAVIALVIAFASLTAQDDSPTPVAPTVPTSTAPIQPSGTG